MPTALVTGAPGFVGSWLCKELLNAGYTVRALHRPSSNLKAIQDLPLMFVQGDLTDQESLKRACAGVDFVFHCGAVYREAKYPDSYYWQINLDGTRNLLEAAKECGVKRFIHCSTTGVHGSIENPPADENYRYKPDDVYQESKTEAEKLVLEKLRSGWIDGCVIRPNMIWGPGDTRLFKLFRGVANRMLPIIGTGQSWCHWILVEDLARAFRLAAENPKSRAQIYLIGGERPVTLEHTMRTIADAYGVKLLPFKIPAWPIQLAGSIVEIICRPLGIEPPLYRRRVDFFVKNRAFVTTKARTELGFKPRFTFEDEARYVAKWYLDNGWISNAAGPIASESN
jgi:dihydroflavonol-4-reductase